MEYDFIGGVSALGEKQGRRLMLRKPTLSICMRVEFQGENGPASISIGPGSPIGLIVPWDPLCRNDTNKEC